MESQKPVSTESSEEKGGNSLPSIPQLFIERFITAYNKGEKLEKCMVEYEDAFKKEGWGNHYPEGIQPKLNGNEVIISECEEKKYSIQELRIEVLEKITGEKLYTLIQVREAINKARMNGYKSIDKIISEL